MAGPVERGLSRTSSWPPATVHLATHDSVSSKSDVEAMDPKKPAVDGYFNEDMEDHPEDHFLSPVYEYEDWASDSEADDDEVEWDAGITDFALFDDDRRSDGDSLDSKWAGFMANQQAALQRSAERNRVATSLDTTRPPLPVEEMPGLTPDSSPSLRDDLDAETFDEPHLPASQGPEYLTITLTPPSPEEQSISEDDELPLFFDAKRTIGKRNAPRKPQRPGLRHFRTLSGKLHSWRRPSWALYSVGENPDAERKAEMETLRE